MKSSRIIEYKFVKYFVVVILIFIIAYSCSINSHINHNDFNGNIVSNISDIVFDYSTYRNNCFAIYGDTRGGKNIHERIVELITQFSPIAVFNTGDLVQNGYNKNQWKEFDIITKNIRKLFPYYPVFGNHDLGSKNFLKRFNYNNGKSFYSVNKNGYLFVLLDSNKNITKGSIQYNWLVDLLKKSYNTTTSKSKFKQIILIFHHPLFSTGLHKEDEKKIKPILLPLIEKYKIKLVFSGHDHCYEKTFYNGTYFITTGGGGAPLYKQTRKSEYSLKYLAVYHFIILQEIKDKLLIKVFDLNLNNLDKIEIRNNIIKHDSN